MIRRAMDLEFSAQFKNLHIGPRPWGNAGVQIRWEGHSGRFINLTPEGTRWLAKQLALMVGEDDLVSEDV